MDKAVGAIVDILNDEIKLYKELLKLSNDKKKTIMGGNVNELDRIVKIEQNIIFDIGQLEKRRELEVDRFCISMGLKREKLTLSEIANTLGIDSRIQLEKAHTELKELLLELKKVNDLNGELIKQSLEYIEFSVDLITSSQVASSSLYEEGKQTKRMFDAKA